MVHHVLEGRWGIAEPKIHDHGFVEAIFCLECGLMLIPVFDAYFIEASFYVELGENECISDFSD